MCEKKSSLDSKHRVALLRLEIDRKYYELGQKVYEIAERDIHDINHLVDKIIQIKQEEIEDVDECEDSTVQRSG